MSLTSSRRNAVKALLAMILMMITVPALAAAQSGAARDYDPLQDRISSARTAADHEAIAREYTRLSVLAEADAKPHERRGSEYDDGVMKEVLQRHCKALAEQSRRQAKEFAGLAEVHHTLAKLAGQRSE